MSSSPARDFIKEHFVLVAGIALPLILIVVFSLARMVTDAAVDPPQYKAVYAQRDPNTYGNGKFNYQVGQDGQLQVTWAGNASYPGQEKQPPVMARSYVVVFNPADNSRQQYVFEVPDSQKAGTIAVNGQMPALKIEPGNTAPDGYTYNTDDRDYYRNGVFHEIFGGNRYYNDRFAIRKNGKSVPLPVQDRYAQFDFIGWTK